jgi:hypothetical protein
LHQLIPKIGVQMENPTTTLGRAQSADRRFWLNWVGASTAAILLGFALLYAGTLLAKIIVPSTNEDSLMGALMWPVLATVQGALQWLVLRARIPRSGWWILATGAGTLAAVTLAVGLVDSVSRAAGRDRYWESWPDLLALFGLIGLFLALAQLPVLWRRVRGLAIWPLVGIVGWLAVGIIMGKSIDRMTDVLALGVVPAAFTGLGLIWLTRSPQSQTVHSA